MPAANRQLIEVPAAERYHFRCDTCNAEHDRESMNHEHAWVDGVLQMLPTVLLLEEDASRLGFPEAIEVLLEAGYVPTYWLRKHRGHRLRAVSESEPTPPGVRFSEE